MTGDVSLPLFPASQHEEDGDVRAGTHVKKQLLLWDTFLEWRIRLQKLLVASNSLPQPEYHPVVAGCGGQELEATRSQATQQLNRLSSALSSLSDVFLDTDGFLFSASSRPVKEEEEIGPDFVSGGGQIGNGADYLQDDDDTEDVEDSCGEEDLLQEEGDVMAAASASKRKRPANESSPYEQLKKIRDEVIDEWYNKTRFSITSSKKGLESFEQPPAAQIRQIMSDEVRLIRRTELRRSDYEIIGKKTDAGPRNERVTNEQKYDCEIFDDDDFYHQILRELIDGRTTDSSDLLLIGRKWLEIQKLRSRMKKKVDTKASKGRKLRYETHKELVNFMAPVRTFEFTEEAIDELFSSLFQ